MDYVKDGTLTIQARTIKEVNSIDRVVVYADGCEGCIWEYREPFLLERPCLACKRNATDFFERRKDESNTTRG